MPQMKPMSWLIMSFFLLFLLFLLMLNLNFIYLNNHFMNKNALENLILLKEEKNNNLKW